MNVLALDLGTHLGWAAGRPIESVWIWGEESFDVRHKQEGGGMRLLRFDRWLGEVIGEVELVVIEEPHHHYRNAAKVLDQMLAIATLRLERYEIPYITVPATTIKKFATGKGNSNKEAMAVALGARWEEIRPDNHPEVTSDLTDNMVDAIWILAYANAHYVMESPHD